ncbi:Sorting nexin-14 [Larimichthys crocea]|uniref:Sorting nexin-14 n=1 Tax=Larimichthys crocea TaxID=215358 RepID=A0A6G0IEV7_LARCR|nr:Sorting nexin-14 [Larimichthys crocea]
MDYLADPDTVNHLLLIFIDNSPPERATEPTSTLVPFLQKYSDTRNKKPSVLKLDFALQSRNSTTGYCCPELSDSEKMMLHEEVKKIYETYCLDESVDKIRFDPFIVEEIRNIAEGPYPEVVKLQTMSDEYFRQLLRGAESPARNSRMSRNSLSLDDIRSWDWSPESPSSLFTASGSSSPASFNSLHAQSTFTTFPYGSLSHRHSSPKNTSKRGESFGISRIGSKIKGVFKSTTMEGAMLPSYGLVEGEDDMVEEAMMVLEDDSPMEAASTPSTPRNLSAWNITIPYIDFYDDDVKRERIPVFCIDVERNDRKAVGHETEHWSVYRRYLEFYVLESKLTEFHGSFPDAQLPSKRIIGPKITSFLHRSGRSSRSTFRNFCSTRS